MCTSVVCVFMFTSIVCVFMCTSVVCVYVYERCMYDTCDLDVARGWVYVCAYVVVYCIFFIYINRMYE
jgi:hypothetical protein